MMCLWLSSCWTESNRSLKQSENFNLRTAKFKREALQSLEKYSFSIMSGPAYVLGCKAGKTENGNTDQKLMLKDVKRPMITSLLLLGAWQSDGTFSFHVTQSEIIQWDWCDDTLFTGLGIRLPLTRWNRLQLFNTYFSLGISLIVNFKCSIF